MEYLTNSPYLFHHSRSLESVIYGEVVPNPNFSFDLFKNAYKWLEKEVDFYPLFVAVGNTKEDLNMTGYQDQWRKIISRINKYEKIYRLKGEIENRVLFSFDNLEGIFMDFGYWHIALNACSNNKYNPKNHSKTDPLTKYEKRLIFKYSYKKSNWLNQAKNNPNSVQLITPKLYLPDAKAIYVRNNETKNYLSSLGFKNIQVRRLLISKY